MVMKSAWSSDRPPVMITMEERIRAKMPLVTARAKMSGRFCRMNRAENGCGSSSAAMSIWMNIFRKAADLIMFNLGYLPGGDHSLATKPDTPLPALEKALALLKEGGLLSLMIYSGGDSGFEEKERVLAWLRELDPKRYMVLVEAFYNRPNNPPLPVFVRKLG